MTPETLQRRLSLNMKRARKGLAFSQERLAEAANISSQMVNDIEGCRRWPSEKTLVKIADALQVDVSVLFLPETMGDAVTPAQRQMVVDDLQRIFSDSIRNYLGRG